jgi:hypothetical protein
MYNSITMAERGLSQFIAVEKDSKGRNGHALFVSDLGWAVLIIVVLVLSWDHYRLYASSGKKDPFQVTSAGYLGTRGQCLDTPGHEKCGSSGEGFLSGRSVGPEVSGSREVDEYYQGAVKQPGSDMAESFKSKDSKHSEHALEGIARGVA